MHILFTHETIKKIKLVPIVKQELDLVNLVRHDKSWQIAKNFSQRLFEDYKQIILNVWAL